MFDTRITRFASYAGFVVIAFMMCLGAATQQPSFPEIRTFLPRPLTPRAAEYHAAIISANEDEKTLLKVWVEDHDAEFRSIHGEHWPALRRRAQELAAVRVTADNVAQYAEDLATFYQKHEEIAARLESVQDDYIEQVSILAGPERIGQLDLIRQDLVRRRTHSVSGVILPTNSDFVQMLDDIVPSWTEERALVDLANRYVREATPILKRRYEAFMKDIRQGSPEQQVLLLNAAKQAYSRDDPIDLHTYELARQAYHFTRRERFRADRPLLQLHRVLLPQILAHIQDPLNAAQYEMQYHRRGYPRFASTIFDLRPMLRETRNDSRMTDEQAAAIDGLLQTFSVDFRDILRQMEKAEDELRHKAFESGESLSNPSSGFAQTNQLRDLHNRRLALATATLDQLALIVPADLLTTMAQYTSQRLSIKHYNWRY